MFRKEKRKIDNMQFLMYVDTDTEACVIQSLLDSCDIFSYLDYEIDGGSLKVVIGNSNLGVNIYVKEEDYEEALSILHSETETEDSAES
jgi:hypothetical protein